jgi:hypothetical protein
MGNLKPIGSEKLEGFDKLKRIMEIARYNEVTPNPINENSSVEYSIMLADGVTYQINKEKTGYVIKKSINEGTFDYIEPMKNRSHYSSYSQAFKRLNLIAKEVNKLTGNDSEISLFSEQKKYTLKAPTPAETPSPDMGMDTPPPSDDAPDLDMGMDMDAPVPDMDGEDLPDTDMDNQSPDMGDEDSGEEMSIKSIQKLTGKLGQKIRSYSSEEELTSDDAKYIINSILSAIDLSILDDEDKDDIMSKFEGEEDMDSDMDVESPESPDMGGEEELPEPEMDGEMAEMDTLGNHFTRKFKSNYGGALMDKFETHEAEGINKIMDEIFSESKVEKIITKYFKIDEKEKKLVESKNKNKVITESKKVAQTYKQETAAEKLINKYPNLTLIGKSNKNNLVFQLEGKKIRITPEGRVL